MRQVVDAHGRGSSAGAGARDHRPRRPGRALLRRPRRRRRPPPAARGAARRARSGPASSPRPTSASTSTPASSTTFLIGDGEAAKYLGTVEDLCRDFARWGLTRGDVVVAVGGGVVTDIAGFAAAVYHRGVAVVHVPTTLLGQVDAAIGGKTGVNLPEGKNLVGAFWQPAAVLCDTEMLATLPPREYRSGLGEMAKYHFLGGDDLLDLPLDEAVAACVRFKAEVVAADEREGPAAGPCSTTATPSPTPSRRPAATTCATARRWPSASCSPPRWPGGSAASTTTRVAEHRRRRRRLRPAAATSRPASTRRAGRCSWAATRRRVDGLTFVLDGPDGVEVVAGRRPPTPSTPPCEATVTERRPLVLLLLGPNLNLLGEREPEIYGTATLARPRRPRPRPPPSAGLELEHLQSNHEGELVDAVHGARGPGRGDRHQRRRPHPLRLVAARRPRRVRGPGRRAAPVEPRRPRGVAPHVGRHAGGHGTIAGFGGHGYRLAVEAVAEAALG